MGLFYFKKSKRLTPDLFLFIMLKNLGGCMHGELNILIKCRNGFLDVFLLEGEFTAVHYGLEVENGIGRALFVEFFRWSEKFGIPVGAFLGMAEQAIHNLIHGLKVSRRMRDELEGVATELRLCHAVFEAAKQCMFDRSAWGVLH
jgi:hypothetical protein